jgi:hypothetical protein
MAPSLAPRADHKESRLSMPRRAALRFGAVAALLSCWWVPLHAQAPPSERSAPQVFASPQHDFQLSYPPPLVQCAAQSNGADGESAWTPFPACQTAVCEDADVLSANTLACIAYPQTEFARKPAFGAGAFYIALVTAPGDARSCLSADPGWDLEEVPASGSAAAPAQPTIGGETAARFRSVDHWMMHARSSVIYRVYHARKCYELGVQRVEVNTGAFDPGSFEAFTPADQARVEQALDLVLRSLRFLN